MTSATFQDNHAPAPSQNGQAVEPIEIPFYDDLIEVILDTRDGTGYASLRRMCENLGVDLKTQLKKLRGCAWATVGIMPTVAQNGTQRELALLPFSQVWMWLASISVNRLRGGPEQREKLGRYQRDATAVLFRHFGGPQAAPQVAPQVMPVPSQDPITAMLESCLATRQAQLALDAKVDGISQKFDGLQRQVEGLEKSRGTALRMLTEVPPADGPAAPLTTRHKCNMRVRDYAAAHGVDHRDVWNKIYREFYYRYGFDAQRRVDYAWKYDDEKITKLEAIDRAGKIEEFYRVVCEICP